VLARLRVGDAIEGDVTLADQLVEEIIGHGHSVCKIHVLPLARDQFSLNVDFNIKIHVSF